MNADEICLILTEHARPALANPEYLAVKIAEVADAAGGAERSASDASILAAMRHCRDVLATNGFDTDAVTLNIAIREFKALAKAKQVRS